MFNIKHDYSLKFIFTHINHIIFILIYARSICILLNALFRNILYILQKCESSPDYVTGVVYWRVAMLLKFCVCTFLMQFEQVKRISQIHTLPLSHVRPIRLCRCWTHNSRTGRRPRPHQTHCHPVAGRQCGPVDTFRVQRRPTAVRHAVVHVFQTDGVLAVLRPA